MIIKCIANSRDSLGAGPVLDNYSSYSSYEEVDLVIGQSYFVLGITFRREVPWYLICGDEEADYPHFHVFGFFEISDGRLPSDWIFSIGSSNAGKLTLLPIPWARDQAFLEKLVDGDVAAIEGYRKIRRGVELWHESNAESYPAMAE